MHPFVLYTRNSIALVWQQTRFALHAVKGLLATVTLHSSAPNAGKLKSEDATNAAIRAFHTNVKSADSSDLKVLKWDRS